MAPHCDSLILHAPGSCEYCDMYPDQQHARIDAGINFTGERDPNKKDCPAEAARGNVILLWGGNLASPNYNVKLDTNDPREA